VQERVLLDSDTVARQGETGVQQAQPLLPCSWERMHAGWDDHAKGGICTTSAGVTGWANWVARLAKYLGGRRFRGAS
jgi:hypothetical protein